VSSLATLVMDAQILTTAASTRGCLLPTSDRTGCSGAGLGLVLMRAVQITRFGGPEVLEIVDVAGPTPGPGQQLYDVSTAGINYADTHHYLS
jgi:hypothetical protein